MLEANDDEDRRQHRPPRLRATTRRVALWVHPQESKWETRTTQDPAPSLPQATAQGGPQPVVAVCEEMQEPTTQHDPLSGRFLVSFSFFVNEDT